MDAEERTKLVDGIKAAISKQGEEVAVVLKKHGEDIERYGKAQEGTKDAVAELNAKGAELQSKLNALEQRVAELPKGNGTAQRKSVGEQFTDSAEFKDFLARGAKGHCSPLRLKDITSIVTSGGAAAWSQRLPGVVEPPLRPLTIRNLCGAGRTSSNLVEWVQENVYTNNADVVSEGTEKPESNITYVRADAPVRTIAHWIHATKQVLSDVPQLQSIIDGRLRWGLGIEEEDQILLGDGTGENLNGLVPQATAYDTSLNRANDTFIDVIRHAILQVRLAFYPATGIVITPTDWHTVELTKDNENRYLMASPSATTPPMLWGLPVVQSDAMTGDNFLVGAFAMAATVFDREEASVMVSTETGSNFINNMVTILAEERLALAVSRPAAFVTGSFPAGSTT